MKAEIQCQVLPARLINEASTVMAQAFCNSPVYMYIFQGDKDYRQNALEWLFRRNLPLICNHYPSALRGIVISDHPSSNYYEKDIIGNNDVVVACFLWTPSPHHKVTDWEMIKAGLWQIPLKFGFSTLLRLLTAISKFDDDYVHMYDNEEIEIKRHNFIMLERMAVRPDFQGKGFGTKCLQTVIDDEEATMTRTRSMRLVTQEKRNVIFYRKLGFEVVGENNHHFKEEDRSYDYHCWYMVRKPSKNESQELQEDTESIDSISE